LPEGREHCAACAGMPETHMHVYRHCPRFAAPRAHLTRAVDEWYADTTSGGALPTREDALRWVHSNAMGDSSCAPLAVALAGDVLRTAAHTFWKTVRKLRWVYKGARAVGGPETRPQVAAAPTAEGRWQASSPRATTAPSKAQSGHQQPGAATRALQPPPLPTPVVLPRPKRAFIAPKWAHQRTTGRCPRPSVWAGSRLVHQESGIRGGPW
jgi:hypothetical protein